MPIQPQELIVPLGVTMNEGVPRELLPIGQLYDVQNGRVRKAGKLEKRYGYELLAGGVGTTLDGSTLTTLSARLLRRDDELLVIDGNHTLHSYSPNTDKWKARNTAPEYQIVDKFVAGQNYQRGQIKHTQQARIGNYVAVAWDDQLGTDQAVCRVFDTTTGALLSEKIDSARWLPRLIATGNYFVFFTLNGTAAPFGIRAWVLDTSDATWTWSSVADVTGLASTDTDNPAGFDVFPHGSSGFVLANIADTGGTLDLYRFSVDPVTLQDSELDIRNGKVITTVNLYGGTTYYVAYYNNTDNQVEVKGHNIATLAQDFAAQVIASPSVDPTVVTVGKKSTTEAWVVWQIDPTGTTANMGGFGFRSVDELGSVHATSHEQRAVRLLSKPFEVVGRSYICATTGYGHPAGAGMQQDQIAVIVLDLGNASVADSTYRCRPVARFGEGEVAMEAFVMSSVNIANDGTGYFSYPVQDPNFIWTTGTTGTQGTSVAVVKLRHPVFDNTVQHWSGWTEFGTNTFVPAALPHHYDGDLVREFWTYYPWIDQISLVAGGSLTVGTQYDYTVCYVAMDNQGRVWRSRPSIIRSFIPTTGNQTIRLRIPHYTTTNQETAFGFDVVGIEIYRRTAASDPFVRLSSVTNGPSEANNKQAAAFLQVDDTGASHVTTSQPNLYTTGGVLEAFTPPPCMQSVVFDNRLWVFDGNVLWYTRELLDNEGPAFHPAQTIVVGDEANITAMAVMDSNLVIFKAESIFVMQGNGPDDTGSNPSYSVPQRVMSPVGCIELRSIAVGEQGIYFQSRRGIDRLRRDLAVEFIGERVEDTTASHPRVTSAVFLQRDSEVRFTVDTTSAAPDVSALVYSEPTDTWATDLFHPTQTDPTVATSAVSVGGSYYWLEENSKRVYKETVDVYDDEFYNGSAIVSKWISLVAETGDIIINNPVGENHWWRVMLFARRIGEHALTLSYTLNQADSVTGAKAWTVADVNAFMGIPIEVLEILPAPQRARSIRFRVDDTTAFAGTPTQGPILYAVAIEVGVQSGVARVPVGQRK